MIEFIPKMIKIYSKVFVSHGCAFTCSNVSLLLGSATSIFCTRSHPKESLPLDCACSAANTGSEATGAANKGPSPNNRCNTTPADHRSRSNNMFDGDDICSQAPPLQISGGMYCGIRFLVTIMVSIILLAAADVDAASVAACSPL